MWCSFLLENLTVSQLFNMCFTFIDSSSILQTFIPVAARSKAWVCGRSLAGIAGSHSAGSIDVCLLLVLCALSGRGLCVELITLPEESY